MPIRVYKPVTNGRRNASVNMHAEVTKKSPEKSLLRPLHKTGGRNCQGKLTVIQQGGGHKRRYRLIDFKRQKDGMKATVVGIEYDPNRTCHIALVKYEDGTLRYILAPKGLTAGDVVVQNGLLGVVKTDIAANALGSLTVEGVFRFTKATGAVAVGQILYYDAANDRCSTDAAVGVPAGKAVAAQLSADTTVDVAINETDGGSQVANVAVAASTALTASSTETNFDNSVVTIPANTLRVGDVIRVRAQGICTATS